MIAPEIRADIGFLLDELSTLGYHVVGSQYSAECFGNWAADLNGPVAFRLAKDRGRFLVDGDRRMLEPAGLWQAFEDRAEFARRVLVWAARHTSPVA